MVSVQTESSKHKNGCQGLGEETGDPDHRTAPPQITERLIPGLIGGRSLIICRRRHGAVCGADGVLILHRGQCALGNHSRESVGHGLQQRTRSANLVDG